MKVANVGLCAAIRPMMNDDDHNDVDDDYDDE